MKKENLKFRFYNGEKENPFPVSPDGVFIPNSKGYFWHCEQKVDPAFAIEEYAEHEKNDDFPEFIRNSDAPAESKAVALEAYLMESAFVDESWFADYFTL